MQIIADLHTHTSVTDHAFSTLTEMVQAAEDRGLAARHHQPRPHQSGRPARVAFLNLTLSRARLAR
ncbi:MAG: hypothetical protein ACLRVN_02580 [Butyricicoccus sp.]